MDKVDPLRRSILIGILQEQGRGEYPGNMHKINGDETDELGGSEIEWTNEALGESLYFRK